MPVQDVASRVVALSSMENRMLVNQLLMRKRPAMWMVLALFLLVPCIAHGGLPPQLEAALFAKILNYDKKIAAKPPAERQVLIVYIPKGSANVREIQDAFTAARIPVTVATTDEAAAKLPGVVAVYIADEKISTALQQAIAGAGVLSLSGAESLANTGSVSVGLTVRDNGRPEIIVHLGRLKAEGHELAAELLALAKVIK